MVRRKRVCVHGGLTNGRWMRGLNIITYEPQLDHFIDLWTQLQDVGLGSENDIIIWKNSADGKYSAKSAYEFQFFGRIPQPDLQKMRSLRVEGKVIFFLSGCCYRTGTGLPTGFLLEDCLMEICAAYVTKLLKLLLT
jgi:hypothetical protein